jgi:hypothetical protein
VTGQRRLLIAGCSLGLLAVLLLYVALTSPRSARELAASISNLPVPLRVVGENVIDECSGMLCQDYHAQAAVRLSRPACEAALGAARDAGYAPLPLPDTLQPLRMDQAPATPARGVYRYQQLGPEEITFSWVDADSCRLYVSYLKW